MFFNHYGMNGHAELNFHSNAKLILKLGLSENVFLLVLLLTKPGGLVFRIRHSQGIFVIETPFIYQFRNNPNIRLGD